MQNIKDIFRIAVYIFASVIMTGSAWVIFTIYDSEMTDIIGAFFALLSIAGWYTAIALIVDYFKQKEIQEIQEIQEIHEE